MDIKLFATYPVIQEDAEWKLRTHSKLWSKTYSSIIGFHKLVTDCKPNTYAWIIILLHLGERSK
jgi:hypothetical protein